MIHSIVQFSVYRRWLVLFLTILIAGVGAYNVFQLNIDAVPDITNVQVQINTEAEGYSPLEVEQRITYSVENAMAGLPNLDYTRSLSRYGLSQVTVVFEEDTDIYLARQLINERLQGIRSELPVGIEPQMGPIATGLGEVFTYSVRAKPDALKADGTEYTAEDLRTIQDWIIRPQMVKVPGVTEINSGEQWLVRSPGQLTSLEDIRNVVITKRDDTPIRIMDVAEVFYGKQLRTGAATQDGKETVLGTAFMLIGENSRC